jgi:alpha-L-arabinofuranosidase
MSAVSDLVNGWPGGIIQASRHRVFVSPIYLVNRLYATHLGTSRLAVDVEGPTFSTTREGQAVPALDVVSSRSANGELIYIKAVNLDLDRPLRATIRVRGARVARSAVVDRVVADSLDAVNGFDTPEAIRAVRTPIAAASIFELRLPAHSIAVVTLRVRR